MSFWSRIGDFFSDLFGGGDDAEPSGADYEPPDYGAGPEDQFSWSLAGYVEAGDSFKDGYVNVEAQGFDNWSFLPDTDYVVVKVTTASGDTYYTTLGGPFDDYEDFYDAILDWWEQGS